MSVTLSDIWTAFILYLLTAVLSTDLKWHEWINLPAPMNKMATTRFNRWIYVIGGNTTDRVFKINASESLKSGHKWHWINHTLSEKPPPDPPLEPNIEIKSDSYITIGVNRVFSALFCPYVLHCFVHVFCTLDSRWIHLYIRSHH